MGEHLVQRVQVLTVHYDGQQNTLQSAKASLPVVTHSSFASNALGECSGSKFSQSTCLYIDLSPGGVEFDLIANVKGQEVKEAVRL